VRGVKNINIYGYINWGVSDAVTQALEGSRKAVVLELDRGDDVKAELFILYKIGRRI
jgi:hypothetical protein